MGVLEKANPKHGSSQISLSGTLLQGKWSHRRLEHGE